MVARASHNAIEQEIKLGLRLGFCDENFNIIAAVLATAAVS